MMNKLPAVMFFVFILFVHGTKTKNVQPLAVLNDKDTLIISHHLERSFGWACRDTLTKSQISALTNLKFIDAKVEERLKGGLTPDYAIKINYKGGNCGIWVWATDKKWYIVDVDFNRYVKVQGALIKQKDLNRFFPQKNCKEESSPYAPVIID